jgi:hypothetical protein
MGRKYSTHRKKRLHAAFGGNLKGKEITRKNKIYEGG